MFDISVTLVYLYRKTDGPCVRFVRPCHDIIRPSEEMTFVTYLGLKSAAAGVPGD